MSIAEVMEQARNCGLVVMLAKGDENLLVKPKKLLTPELKGRLLAKEPEIVEVLKLERLWEMPSHDPRREEAV